jgi:hypothetical protein
MENPLNVPRLKLLSALGIATLSAIVAQPLFAAEIDASSPATSLAAIPEISTSSDRLLIARNPKTLKRRKVKASKRRNAPIAETVQPTSSVPSAPSDESPVTPPAIQSTEPNPSIPGNNTPLNQAPIPTTVQPTQTSTPNENYSVNIEGYSSFWSDNFGNNGSQIVTPLTVTYAKDDFNVGIRTAFINSNFNGVLLLDGQKIGTRKGSVSTQSDTSLSLAYNLKQSDFPIRFNLDFNLPTGKATLSGDQKNAIMDGSLVQQTRFGEGFNIAPGVSISHALSPKDIVGLGFSYILKGQFDPNGDVVNDEIKPGNEAVATLQYSHIEPNWTVSGGLNYTGYGTTQRGGRDYYRSGDRLDANVSGLISFSNTQRLRLNSRYFTQAENSVANFLTGDLAKESANSNGSAIFLGADWSIATDPQQRSNFHILADYLSVQANSYDRINDLFNAGRDKFSIGLGYDYAFNRNTRAAVQAKYYQVLDRATPITQQDIKSNGASIFATLNYNF